VQALFFEHRQHMPQQDKLVAPCRAAFRDPPLGVAPAGRLGGWAASHRFLSRRAALLLRAHVPAQANEAFAAPLVRLDLFQQPLLELLKLGRSEALHQALLELLLR
jgi:hypothetical protein